MNSRSEIVHFTNTYLKLNEYSDYGPMGLQYTGADRVRRIATAVSVSAEVIEKAAEWGADMLLTHHGLWWNNESRLLDKRTQGRIDLLDKHNMSLAGYHLCLDAHPEIGNNIQLAKIFDLQNLKPFGEIGFGGERPLFPLLKTSEQWLEYYFGNKMWSFFKDSIVYDYNPRTIQKVAVIAGGAPSYLSQAHAEGYDTFITGEAAEYTIYQAQELGMTFIAAGHHRTEILGIRLLGEKLADQFALGHKFFNADNRV